MTQRVQIPAYTERWMMGDRFGEIVSIKRRKADAKPAIEIARVKLDISGRTLWFVLDDCTPI